MEHYKYSNLLQAFEQSSKGKNGIIFIDSDGKSFLSYEQLYKKSLGISGYLIEKVNSLQNEIILLLDTNKKFVPVFWACIAAKIKAVPVAVGNSDEHKLKLFKVWENLKSPYLITSKKIFDELKNFAAKNNLEEIISIIEERLIYEEDIHEKEVSISDEIKEDDIAFIQYSSGSTGAPKGVILTHKNLIITVSAYIRISEISFNDSFLSWFPLTHDMGLIGWHILPVFAGFNQILIETNIFVRKPAIWMDIASELKSTILCSPNFGYKHFLGFTKKLDNANWDLTNVRIVANGAEPISPKLCEQFLKALEPFGLKHEVMTPGYGLAELGLIATISDYRKDFETIHLDRAKLNVGEKISETDESSKSCLSFVCEGKFIRELEVKITDNKGIVLPDEHVGHIYLKGESVTNGYYNNKIDTKKSISKDGWLDTGDLGFMKDNKLFLTGRSKELIIINGYNYYPHDIERVCFSIEELDFGKVVAAGVFEESLEQEVLIIFVYYKNDLAGFNKIAGKIKETILKTIGLSVFEVIPVKKIPKTTSGKIQRFLLLESYKKGEFNEVLSKIVFSSDKKDKIITDDIINTEFVINKLKEIVNRIINVRNLDENEVLVNYGIDSIRGSELLGIIKEYFNLEFDEFIYFSGLSLSSAAEVILSNIEKKREFSRKQNKEPGYNSLGKVYKISSGQFSIFYHYKNYPLSSAYNISISCRILNEINFDKLNQAYNFVINRHEILKARYFVTDDLCYKTDEEIDDEIEVVETDESVADKLKILVKKKTDYPFDIENGNVIRAFLFKTNNHGSIFTINIHHIAGDARSLLILLKEVLISYNELTEYSTVKSLTPNSGFNYSDYIIEDIKYSESELFNIAKNYWKNNLTGIDFGLNLPNTTNTDDNTAASSILFEIDHKGLRNVSGFSFYLSAYCYLLHRYTQQNEVIVGIPVSDSRVITNKRMNEELVGYTINTLPIKSVFDSSWTVNEYVEEIKCTILEGMKYQNYPISKIAEDLNPSRNNKDTLLSTMFTALPVNSSNLIASIANPFDEKEIGFGSLHLKSFYIPQQEGLFDLSMEMIEQNNKIIFRVSFNSGRYYSDFIGRFISHYKNIIEEFILSPYKKLPDIEILSHEEKSLLDSFNETHKDYDNFKPIISLIEEQSIKTPGNTAYIFNDIEYSYKWVNEKANRLAAEIIKTGVDKGTFIPLYMNKGIELPISMLAVMKAGCAFIPLDVDVPDKRLRILINDINPKIILTVYPNYERLSGINNTKIIVVNLEEIECLKDNLNREISIDDPIYGIYTSGTTGIPKCAVNLHKGITNRFRFMDDYFGIDEKRVVIHSANSIFDTTVYQLFWPLTHGAKIVIPEASGKLNLEYLLELIYAHNVTYIDLVPSVFNILVEYFENSSDARKKFQSIKYLSIGGEAVVPKFVFRFKKYFPEIKITNIYGPTETAIGITFCDIKEFVPEIPIGKPITNTRIYILDKNKKQLPIGINGEIYIGGYPVGSGYLNDPQNTAELFVNDIIDTGSGKLYKTGDLGCFLPDGNILFKGRIDEQIKIRGVRIEPDEIRTNIINIDYVLDAVVLAKENGNDETQLAAYVIFKNKKHSIDELKNDLLRTLPEILIPQYIIPIDKIPLNANGKVDKKALVDFDFTTSEFSGEKVVVSGKLYNIWCEVLGRENIGINDKFFNSGGNSLKALQLKIKIQKNYGVEFGIEEILRNPSLQQLEESLTKQLPEISSVIQKVEKRDFYPLSHQQKRMWLLYNSGNSSRAYSMIGVFHVKGKVDLSILYKSWELLIKHHETLRTYFQLNSGEPVQVISDNIALDYRDIRSDKIDFELQKVIAHERNYSFDLSKLPLFRITTIADGKDNVKLVLHFHHIITDGWSIRKLFEELSSIYNSLLKEKIPELNSSAIHYKDYTIWFEKEFESKKLKEAGEYWNKKLSGEKVVTSIPKDYEDVKQKDRTGKVKKFTISGLPINEIIEFCKEEEITLFMFLISAVEIVLFKYTRSNEIVLGTPVSGRDHPELEELQGLFVNTIILKNKIIPGKKYSEFIKGLKEEILESYKYQVFPFDKLVETNSGGEGSDLFEVFVSFESRDDEIGLQIDGSENIYEEIGNEVNKFPINIMFHEKSNGLQISIEYDCGLYKEERILNLGRHLENIFKDIINDPVKKLSELNILSKDEEEKLSRYIVGQKSKNTSWKSVIDQFIETAAENENRLAVYCNEQYLTFKQLNIYSDKVASALIERGIQEENIVGLLTTKSIEMIAGIIGIMKAGAAYLPLDPEHPAERLNMIIKDSGCKFILTNTEKTPEDYPDVELLNLDEIRNITKEDKISLPRVKPAQPAYVIYTSGSTGTPKGVLIEHHSLTNLVSSLCSEVYDICGKNLNVALNASYIFDASIQQIFPSLVRGDTLHLINDEIKLNGKLTAEYFMRHEINIADATPTLFDLQLKGGFVKREINSLKHLLIGGEALNYELLNEFFGSGKFDDVTITNMYGPTECCVDTVCYKVTKDTCQINGKVPIGKSMLNTGAYILDDKLKLVPEGIIGELFLCGENVGRGYVNNEELTKSKFFQDPFSKNNKLYKTGDLCSYSFDGNIVYYGRIDNQIKIRGYRVEPGEIESLIDNIIRPSRCIVIYNKNENELVVFIEAGEINKSFSKEIFDKLRNQIPSYMLPSKYILIDELPLTSSGKPDRIRLEENLKNYKSISFQKSYEPPRNETEKKLVEIWKDILGIPDVGIDDNFYELGGHSLKALKIMTAVFKSFGTEINYKDILTNPTIKAIAEIIDINKKKTYSTIPLTAQKDYYDLSHAQKRIWLECELGRSNAYNVTGGFRLYGKIDVEVLNKSLIKLFNRHESLRTTFKYVDGYPKQLIDNNFESILSYIDLSAFDNPEESLKTEIKNISEKSINIFKDNLFNFSLIKVKNDEYYLLALIHHIITDGWSVKIMLEELSQFYNSIKNSTIPILPELKIQYKDYSSWFEKEIESPGSLAAKVYWDKKLSGDLQFVSIPYDDGKLTRQTESGKIIHFEINKEVTKEIREYTVKKEITVFMFMLSAVEIVLQRYSGIEDIMLGTPVSGRNHPDLERQLGLYTNTIIIRNEVRDNKKYSEYIYELKNEVLDSYNYQNYPFDKLIEENLKRNNGKFFNMFISHETEEDEIQLNLEGIVSKYEEVETGKSKFDLSITCREKKQQIDFIFEYSTCLYCEDTIERFGKDVEKVILSILKEDSQTINQISINSENGDIKDFPEERIKKDLYLNKSNKYKPPRTSIEKEIEILWREVLNINRAGIDDNFFEQGGHSIKALQLVTLLKEKYNLNLELKYVFSYQTIADQAKEIENILWLNKDDGSSSGEEIII